MSSALAIASVTAVLRELLRDALVDHDVSTIVADAEVSAVAPDQIAVGNGETGRLNLYLYGVAPNQGWRNHGLPSRDGGGERLTNPPLALDLHYLVTAYGADDFHAEVLLGHAMHRLHEVPVLERATVRDVLGQATILDGRLADSALADQVEQIKLTPEGMSTEELSGLWTAFQASYRPSAAYLASVVLIEAEEAVRTPLPVLTRGEPHPVTGQEQGAVVVAGLVPPHPTLTALEPPDDQPAARLGETVRLHGHHLDGSGHGIVFAHARLGVTHTLAPDAVGGDELTVTIPPGAPADWPAGLYAVHVTVIRDGTEQETNTLALALAPSPDITGITVTTTGGTATIEVPVVPEVWPPQQASLVLGRREVLADDHPTRTGTLTFEVEDAASGTYFVRLRVDGVESLLVDRTTSPPSFDPSQQVTIP